MKTMTIDGIEYVRRSDIKELEIKIPEGDKSNPFMVVGKDYFLRTVTHYFTGHLLWVGDKELAFVKVCWIADTGKFNEFTSGKTVSESEPYPVDKIVIIGRGSIIDMAEHDLILTVK